MLQRNDAFSVVHWCGAVPGVVGKAVRWDALLRFECDLDCCLGELLDTCQSQDRAPIVVERRTRVEL